MKILSKACYTGEGRDYLHYIHIDPDNKRIEATNGYVYLSESGDFTNEKFIDPKTLLPVDYSGAYPDCSRLIPTDGELVHVISFAEYRPQKGHYLNLIVVSLSNERKITFYSKDWRLIKNFFGKKRNPKMFFMGDYAPFLCKTKNKIAVIMPIRGEPNPEVYTPAVRSDRKE